jgi:hypothetical protein
MGRSTRVTTAIACTIAVALAAAGLDAPRPDVGRAASGPAGAAQPAADPPSGMTVADSGLWATASAQLSRAVVGPHAN